MTGFRGATHWVGGVAAIDWDEEDAEWEGGVGEPGWGAQMDESVGGGAGTETWECGTGLSDRFVPEISNFPPRPCFAGLGPNGS